MLDVSFTCVSVYSKCHVWWISLIIQDRSRYVGYCVVELNIIISSAYKCCFCAIYCRINLYQDDCLRVVLLFKFWNERLLKSKITCLYNSHHFFITFVYYNGFPCLLASMWPKMQHVYWKTSICLINYKWYQYRTRIHHSIHQ